MDGFAEGRSIVSYIIDKLDNKYILLIPTRFVFYRSKNI